MFAFIRRLLFVGRFRHRRATSACRSSWPCRLFLGCRVSNALRGNPARVRVGTGPCVKLVDHARDCHLLWIVVVSYRLTIFSYPQGGGI